ncbi:MAG: S8 family serine peptidase [Armatimonadota bacterium]
MKLIKRLLLPLVLAVFAAGQALADGVICQVIDQNVISSIVTDYTAILGVDIAGQSPFVRFEVAPVDVELLEIALSTDPRIVWVEDEDSYDAPENQSGHGSSVAAIYDRTAVFGENKNIWKQINFAQIGRQFAPLRVGIVDTGVSRRQPSITANIVAKESFVANSPTIDDQPTLLDSNNNGILDEGAGHGTMVAGIILQLSPNTPLVIAKSADSDGMSSSWLVMKGVVFCMENGSRVINISLGSPNRLAGFSSFMDWVGKANVTVVSPIGNNNLNMTLFPAGYSPVISVAGLLPDNTRAPFSNWDNTARVAAPATGILSAWWDGGTAIWSGTSFSAPLTTGCLALALAVNPSKSPSAIRSAFTNSGKSIDNLNPNYRGRLGKLLDFIALVGILKR